MKITTETGSVYTISDDGAWWSKNGGYRNKVWSNFCISDDVTRYGEIFTTERLPLTIGLRMYVAGRDEWALSTAIVSIEEDDNE